MKITAAIGELQAIRALFQKNTARLEAVLKDDAFWVQQDADKKEIFWEPHITIPYGHFLWQPASIRLDENVNIFTTTSSAPTTSTTSTTSTISETPKQLGLTQHRFFARDPFAIHRLHRSYEQEHLQNETLRQNIEPSSMNTILQHTKAAWQGTCESLGDIQTALYHLATSPIDSFVKPTAVLAWDSLVLRIAHYPLAINLNPNSEEFLDYISLKTLLGRMPEVYNNSKSNMEKRLDHLKTATLLYLDADEIEQTRMTARLITNILVPGTLAKATKTVGSIVLAKNAVPIEELLTFKNLYPHQALIPESRLNFLNLSAIRAIENRKPMLYVILQENGKNLVRIVEEAYLYVKGVQGKEFMLPSNPGVGFRALPTQRIRHSDIAGGKPVVGAGRFIVQDGRIHHVNECSGHYKPYGSLLKSHTEKALMDFGLTEAEGAFYHAIPPELLQTTTPSILLPGWLESANPAAAAVGIGGIIEMERSPSPSRAPGP